MTDQNDQQRRDDLLERAEQWRRRHGPANCWTGSTRSACDLIAELAAEIKRLAGEAAG